MSINYGLDKNLTEKIDQHVDRVKRLHHLASTNPHATDAVRQSLTYLKGKAPEEFQELMDNSSVAGIYGEHNQRQDPSSQGNSSQGVQSHEESQQQMTRNLKKNVSVSPETHLVLTVGTNALPVWIAWYHLNKVLGPVSTQLVYTLDTQDQKELLENYLSSLSSILISESKPNIDKIHDEIRQALPDTCKNLHIHYTGGTQAMGVATVLAMRKVKSTLKSEGRKISIDMSYLDPGRSGPPQIVSGSTASTIKKDTREFITPKMKCQFCIAQACTQITEFNCNACLRKVADLNNFEVAYFTSNHPPETCPHPKKPSDNELCAAKKILDHIQSFTYRRNRNDRQRNRISDDPVGKWNRIFHDRNSNFNFKHPANDGQFSFIFSDPNEERIWKNEILPVLNDAYPACRWDTSNGYLPYPSYAGATNNQKTDLKGLDTFLNGGWLEYAAYAAFEKTLQNIDRNNYEIFNNVYIRKKGAEMFDKHFELDVVAVLGYQVIVVSCSVTNVQSRVKLKAMEAYHRAKQLGGDEARAVVLCVASADITETIQDELKDETGTKDPLQVWGRCNMQELRKKFEQLLRDLHWV